MSNLLQQIPGFGPFLSAYIALTGCDPVAGTPVSSLERGLAGLNAMGPVLEALHASSWCEMFGGGCFAKGTMVAMADGSHKPIEQIQVGDWVQSRNEATGEVEARQVTATTVHRTLQTVAVTLADAKTGQRQTIVCTPSHPFYVQGQGFTPAGSLGIGTSIVTRAGPSLLVSSVGLQPEQAGASEGTLVYNLTVEGDHTYFVGTVDGGAWVHKNACLSREARDLLRSQARDIWQAETGRRAIWDGLEVHHRIPLEYAHLMPGDPNRIANLVGVDFATHNAISAQWTAMRTALRGATPTAAQVMRQALDINAQFGSRMRLLR